MTAQPSSFIQPSSPTQESTAALRFDRAMVLAFSGILALLAAAFVMVSRHWPVVSDAALMQYTVFLIQHGWSPYRDFLDVNMPGAYLVTAAAMHLPATANTAWRIFDLGLVLAAGAGYYAIARVYSRFAAVFAAGLLLLVHGQDGIQQAGQRDLVMAVLLLLGVASLLEAVRRDRWLWLLPFGLATGLAATIKPTAAPLGLVTLALCVAHRAGWWRSQRTGRRSLLAWSVTVWSATGLLSMAFPLGLMLLWLQRHHALAAWFQTQRTLLPYYATLGHRPAGFTLLHSLSPLLPLVLLWLGCVAAGGPRWDRFERLVIVTVTALCLLSLLAQGKALPYQRYPMLAFLLLLIALDLTTALRGRRIPRMAAIAGLACGCLILAPLALVRTQRFQPTEEFKSMLAADLHRVHAGLGGEVQCLDSIQECLPTLYALRLEPATGTLYDVFLFGDAQQPAVQLGRQRFSAQLAAHPPAAIVIVSGFFLEPGGGYAKLETWPTFQQWLAQHYTLDVERVPPHPVRWWSRAQPAAGYRLYLARPCSASGAVQCR